MTKKKAIEAALRQYDDDGSAESLAERTYEAGRIAGLREAAKIRSVDGRCAGGAISVSRAAITDYANALAKKARTK